MGVGHGDRLGEKFSVSPRGRRLLPRLLMYSSRDLGVAGRLSEMDTGSEEREELALRRMLEVSLNDEQYVGKFLQILVRVFRVSPFERRHDNGRGH